MTIKKHQYDLQSGQALEIHIDAARTSNVNITIIPCVEIPPPPTNTVKERTSIGTKIATHAKSTIVRTIRSELEQSLKAVGDFVLNLILMLILLGIVIVLFDLRDRLGSMLVTL